MALVQFNSIAKKMIANVFFSIPVLGWDNREAVQGGAQAKTLVLACFILAWALAIMQFGYPAIIVPALALVRVLFAFFFAVSWPYSEH